MSSEHHEHSHHHHNDAPSGPVLTIRAHSGLSGDIFLAGLLCMTGLDKKEMDERLAAVMPELKGAVHLMRREVNHIGGMHAQVDLPRQHEHRTLADVLSVIAANGMAEEAKKLAAKTFTILARAEAAVHGKTPEEVHFHEVGALDSILDICMSCELFCLLAPSRFVVSPLPMADGFVRCAHGVIPVPAPAVLELMDGIPVRPFPGQGETVTPTAMALLKALPTEFGPWPSMRVEKKALVYGTHVFEDAPNGVLFACGSPDADQSF
ncbi:LarC family nickel insertion protein [Mailhella massiliensis]|uniref:LarC family nickel insertion protein n=1 Tax=Mailhella massiliensis TaxID=1903261 RepID=A0A921DRI9_9BACT|nr:LarC family nickel insertion protein [Mailhella massiliensis]HJD97745.1 LarC family nickel insertion protein [Mailhella massiliensis]